MIFSNTTLFENPKKYILIGSFQFIGSTLAIFSVTQWLTLIERLGPVIINVSRVANDLITIIINYMVLLFAFSFGIYFVLKVNVIAQPSIQKDTSENNVERLTFMDIWKLLWWTLLNPGPDSEAFPEEGLAGVLTNALFIIYQIFSVIMLLNLLIAMMNTTIQKIQDKRLLYWKFERTQIWIDFINDGYVIPPPFLIFAWVLSCVLYLAGIFGVTVKRWHNKRRKNQTEMKPSIIENGNDTHRKSDKKYLCKMDPNEARRRKAHAILMNKLISNLLLKTNYHTT